MTPFSYPFFLKKKTLAADRVLHFKMSRFERSIPQLVSIFSHFYQAVPILQLEYLYYTHSTMVKLYASLLAIALATNLVLASSES